MNLPSRLQDDAFLVEYWSQAATAAGRRKLAWRRWRKKAAWRLAMATALFVKRAMDVTGALAAMIALSPVLVVTVLSIKLEDGGPLFFQQTRVGRAGRTFGMWKFRSMVVNADQLKDQLLQQNEMSGGVTFKMKNDPRVTRVGRFIRKFSIDELPQLWNILRGEMSLVGPRPPVPREVAEYTPEQRQRLLVTPGLTCFWQTQGRSAIPFDGQVMLDVAYIRSESLWVDIKLLFKTLPAVLFGTGAY